MKDLVKLAQHIADTAPKCEPEGLRGEAWDDFFLHPQGKAPTSIPRESCVSFYVVYLDEDAFEARGTSEYDETKDVVKQKYRITIEKLVVD